MCGAEEQRRVNRLDLEGLWMDIVLRGLLHAVGELVVGGFGLSSLLFYSGWGVGEPSGFGEEEISSGARDALQERKIGFLVGI